MEGATDCREGPERSHVNRIAKEFAWIEGKSLERAQSVCFLEKMPWPNTTGHGMISTQHFHIARTTRV